MDTIWLIWTSSSIKYVRKQNIIWLCSYDDIRNIKLSTLFYASNKNRKTLLEVPLLRIDTDGDILLQKPVDMYG